MYRCNNSSQPKQVLNDAPPGDNQCVVAFVILVVMVTGWGSVMGYWVLCVWYG